MSRNLIKGIVVMGTLFCINGCSTIISGAKQQMSFQSSPEGATVTVNGRILGKTPLSFQLDKKQNQTATFDLDGYKPITMELSTRLDSWFWGNIVIGGVLGSTTDGVTGAVHEYSPSQYIVNMVPLKTSRLEVHTTQSSREKIREFVLVRYQNIVAELNKGTGDDINSLFALLSVSKDRESTVLSNIKNLSEDTKDIYAFADKVSQFYSE